MSDAGRPCSLSTSRELTRPVQAGSVLRGALRTHYRRATAELQPVHLAAANAVMLMRTPFGPVGLVYARAFSPLNIDIYGPLVKHRSYPRRA